MSCSNNMEINKQPVKEVLPLPRSPTLFPEPSLSSPLTPAATSKKHTTESIQHVHLASSVVTSLSHLRPPERDLTPLSQMKAIKCLKRAGLTTVFTGQTVSRVTSDNIKPRQRLDREEVLEESPAIDVILADIDSLVPTHDGAGRPIPEWKRQVMVQQLQFRLRHEEDYQRQAIANGFMSADAWKFSLAHSGILGPFGELLTEGDLVYLQQQIESVSLQKRCQAYELELTRLTEELRAILPDPIVNISLNKDILQQMDSEGKINLTMPVWCSRISEMITNMSLLVSNLTQTTEKERDWRMVEGVVEEMKGLQGIKDISGGGLGQRLVPQGQEMESTSVETSSGCRMPHIGIASAFSQRLENDSYSRARRERVEREIQQSGVSVRNLRSNFEGQIGEVNPVAGVVQVERELKGKKKGEDSRRSSSKIGYLSQEASNECVPVYDTKGLRKERIVVLFLSHWKKSAYAISVRAAKQRQNAASGKTAAQSQKSTSLLQLYLQQGAVAKTLNSWRSKLKDAQSHLTQHPRPRVTYSPEHFLPDANGVTMSHDSLTLDLFMLGYFHILEQDLSAEERKMRHLLCFEVFDHVGSFPWEKVRDFHKAVLQEIQSGRKQWSDGFEDLKTHFFGEPKPCSCPLSSSLLMPESKSLPKVIIQGASPEESGNDTDFSCFNNEDICKYIDRSFAFWKEKEAELFDFDH